MQPLAYHVSDLLEVRDAHTKRVGLTVDAMTGDRWLYNKLRRFRAGIEAIISYLKRCFGPSR